MPILSTLVEDLLFLPASSASCERSFSLLTRIMSAERTSIGAQTMAAQMGVASFLQQEGKVGIPNPIRRVQPARAADFTTALTVAWCASRVDTVERNDQIVVYYVSKGKEVGYPGKVVELYVGNTATD
jgi:hypothetical protein